MIEASGSASGLTVRPFKNELIGVSQLVLGVNSIVNAEAQFAKHGYYVKGRMMDVLNPREKRHFVGSRMAERHDLSMLVPTVLSPLVELVHADQSSEDHEGTTPAFEAIMAPQNASEDEILDAVHALLSNESIARPLPGLCIASERSDILGVRAVIVRCEDIASSLLLPLQLGLHAEHIDAALVRIVVRGLMPGVKLSLYFVHAATVKMARPDQIGVICVTFLCRDADRVAEGLASFGHDVGERFDLAPFGTPVRVFFMRSASGEMYEFLSVRDARPI